MAEEPIKQEESKGFEIREVEPMEVLREARAPRPEPVAEPKEKEPLPVIEDPQGPAPKEPEKEVTPAQELVEATVDYKTEYEKAQQRLAELEKKNNPYRNSNYYKLEVIEEESPSELPLYQKLVLGNPDSKELWKMGFVKEHPELADRPDVVERRFQKAYPALFDSTSEDQDVADAKIDLDIDAARIKREMLARLDKINVPDPKAKEAEVAQKNQEFVNSWKIPFQQLSKDTKFAIEVPDEKDPAQKESFEFDIPDGEKRKYFEQAAAYVLGNQLPSSEKTYSQVKDYMSKLYVADHSQEIATKIAREIGKKRDELWSKKVTNPEPLRTPAAPAPKAGTSKEEKVEEFLKQYTS